MTVDEFLVWDAEGITGRRCQLIDGEPMLMASATDVQRGIQAELLRLLGDHLHSQNDDCSVVITPGIIPRVGARENFRVPDLGVMRSPAAGESMVPHPILLIEIPSPGNQAITRANVWAYTTIPTLREILVVRSTRIEVEVLRRTADGNWPASPLIVVPPATVELLSIGFAVPVGDLYSTVGSQL